MSLRERYIKDTNGDGAAVAIDHGNQSFQEITARLHRTIISHLDLTKLKTLSPDRVRSEVSRLAEDLLLAESLPLSIVDHDRLVSEVLNELFGLGPIEALLSNPGI